MAHVSYLNNGKFEVSIGNVSINVSSGDFWAIVNQGEMISARNEITEFAEQLDESEKATFQRVMRDELVLNEAARRLVALRKNDAMLTSETDVYCVVSEAVKTKK